MGAAKYLIVVVLLTTILQNIECRGAREVKIPSNEVQLLRANFLEQLSDQIRDSALASWNFVKKIAQTTRANIRKWADTARKYALNLQNTILKQIREVQKRLNSLLTNTLAAGNILGCVENEVNNLSRELESRFNSVTSCVNEQLSSSSRTTFKASDFNLNDTVFITDLERRLDTCKVDEENHEECMQNVKDLIFDELEEKQLDIYTKGLEAKDKLDSVTTTMRGCFQDNWTMGAEKLMTAFSSIMRCTTTRSK